MKTKAVFMSMFFLFAAIMQIQAAARQQVPAEKPTMAAAIPGVIAAGTKVDLVWKGLNAGDGLIAERNGTPAVAGAG